MFRLGFNVGLNWEKFKEKGFKKVCCGCMIEDTPFSEKNTSFACDWLFPHGFALGLDISEQPAEEQEDPETQIQKHLKSIGIDVHGAAEIQLGASLEERHPWIKLARQDLPIVNFKDMDTKYQLQDAAIQPTCVGHKKFLPNDFDYIPFGRTYVYYDLKTCTSDSTKQPLTKEGSFPKDRKDIINTKNSVKEMIMATCLGNKDDKKRQGIVIAVEDL